MLGDMTSQVLRTEPYKFSGLKAETLYKMVEKHPNRKHFSKILGQMGVRESPHRCSTKAKMHQNLDGVSYTLKEQRSDDQVVLAAPLGIFFL